MESKFNATINKTEANSQNIASEIKEDVNKGTTFENKEDLNQPYLYKSKITIVPVTHYSYFREVNKLAMDKRKEYIGSSVYSSQKLSANMKEIETYFPNILGIGSKQDEFFMRVKMWLNNIKIAVEENGRTFDNSFYYKRKADYLKFKAEEEKIENAYKNADKSSIKKIKEALKIKIEAINELESQKVDYGYPINIEEYILYRHCLFYNAIAKDTALINSDKSYRFYFKDEKKETDRLRKYRTILNLAKSNYIETINNDELFNAMYIRYCDYNNYPILSSIAKDRISKEIELDKFSVSNPAKFNEFHADANLKLHANIELLIARGELYRSENNQNITTMDGEFIGSNIKEAIEWFKKPEHNSILNNYLNKLKNI